MRNARLAAITTILALGFSAPSIAGTLPFTGTLSIQAGAFPPVVVAGSGTAVINGSGSGGHLTSLSIGAGSFQATHVEVPLTDLSSLPIVGMRLTMMNEAGSFSGSGGAGFGGVMPLTGVLKLCTYPTPCSAAINNIVVLLAVGDFLTATVMELVSVTVAGAPWTTGTVQVGTSTAMGGVAPLSGTGAASGSITLVTPIFISTNIGALPVMPSFGILTLHFVPEPATLVLFGAGIAGIAAFGRARLRS